jgi:hypothetical protein
MSGFEFAFSLFGLLLGFSMVEVLGGFARAVEARVRPAADRRAPLRLGWLTPMLGIFVMLDLTSFWLAAWAARDQLDVGGPVMFGGLVFAGSYYLAAHAVFPSDPAAHDELDGHYFRVRRSVFGILTALLLAQFAYWLSVPELRTAFADNPWLFAELATVLVLMGAAMLVKSRAANIALLALLIAQYLYDYAGEPALVAAGIL